MSRQISEERKVSYYIGTLLMVIGGILFASTFVIFATNFGNFSNFEQTAKSCLFTAISGMVLLIIGGIVRGIGAMGLAGSGVVLDPQQAREELEPYSRQAGGMVKDALDEADIHLGNAQPAQIIKVKCTACGKLNDEDAKFCQGCGKQL